MSTVPASPVASAQETPASEDEGHQLLADRAVLEAKPQSALDRFQGYLFARPGPAFPLVHWDP